MDRRKFTIKLVCAAILFAGLSYPAKAAAQNAVPEQGPQEIYLSFNYSGLVSTVITSLYYRDSVFLPIGSIFKQLRINRDVNPKAGVVGGFFVDASTPYELNFATHTAKIGSRLVKFDSTDFIRTDLDYFLLPSLYMKLFRLSFTVDFNALSLQLSTDRELPVARDYQREMRRNYMITTPQASLIQAPLSYPRKRSLLNGGVLDYSVSSYYGEGQSAYNYSLTGGAEILGGDAQGTVQGSITRDISQLYSSNLSWKYIFDSSRYISTVGIGNLFSDGLNQYGFRGVQVSNEPVTVRTYFSKYQISAKTNPNWDVELYLNGQLVGYAKADAAGNARFTIPLVYGTSFIQMKYYGPSGEYQESDQRLQIPFTFLPGGEVDYSASAGRLNNTDYDFLEGNVYVGLTDWLTDKIGMDYVNSPFYSKPVFFNSMSVRFSPEYMLSLDAAPSAYYRTTFNALYASQAAFDIMFANYSRNLLYNPGARQQELQGDIYLPFSFDNGGFGLRASGDALRYFGGEEAYSYSIFATAGISQFNLSAGYVGTVIGYGGGGFVRNSSITASLLYSLFFDQGAFDFLNGGLVNATARFGVLRNSVDDIQLEFSKNVMRYIRVGISAERDFVNRSTNFNLQIIADLPFTRSTTTATAQKGSGWLTENLSGAVGFDANYRSFIFNDIQWVGHSATSMRMFVDYNGNGIYDRGEPVIKDGSLTLRQGVASEFSRNGIVREWNLLPYTQYSADINLASIRNPLWIPRQKSFSFVTDPESYKRIDIPFYVGGIVDGTVMKLDGGRETPVAGLTLEIKSEDSAFHRSVSVFNDGSFYYMGLPPGDYEAYVDSSQLAILGVISQPSLIRFTVLPTRDGDMVEGLKILLIDKESLETGALMRRRRMMMALAQRARGADSSVAPAGGYVVQAGAFVVRRNADRFAKQLAKKSGMKIVVSRNRVTNMFVVQTDTFKVRGEALGALDLFLNKLNHPDAFIVGPRGDRSGYRYSVQVASFRSLGAAADFSEKFHKQQGGTPSVQFNRTTLLFSVVVGPFETEKEASVVAGRLRRERAYENAVAVVSGQAAGTRMYTVSLGVFARRSQADEFANEFRMRTGLIALQDFDSKKLQFVVFTPAYETDGEAMKALDRIRSFKGYTAAQLIQIP